MKIKKAKKLKADLNINVEGSRSLKNYMNFLIFLGLFTANTSQAKNLGVWGALFPVVEQDIKEFILERLNQMQQSGELRKIKGEFIKNVKKHVLRPVPVKGITTTDKPTLFYYDPTYVLEKDIEDEKGKVIVKAGTVVNPLDTIKLRGVLFFIDADDKHQVQWALDNVKKYDYVKYILVKGDIKEAGKRLNDRIYFDQYGLISRKLGIRHIPCVVKQDGKRLQIQEFALKKRDSEILKSNASKNLVLGNVENKISKKTKVRTRKQQK